MSCTRESALRGSQLSFAKLNEVLVKRIRMQHARKERLKRLLDERYSSAAFAKRYGVSRSAVEKVLCYQHWRHVL